MTPKVEEVVITTLAQLQIQYMWFAASQWQKQCESSDPQIIATNLMQKYG